MLGPCESLPAMCVPGSRDRRGPPGGPGGPPGRRKGRVASPPARPAFVVTGNSQTKHQLGVPRLLGAGVSPCRVGGGPRSVLRKSLHPSLLPCMLAITRTRTRAERLERMQVGRPESGSQQASLARFRPATRPVALALAHCARWSARLFICRAYPLSALSYSAAGCKLSNTLPARIALPSSPGAPRGRPIGSGARSVASIAAAFRPAGTGLSSRQKACVQ